MILVLQRLLVLTVALLAASFQCPDLLGVDGAESPGNYLALLPVLAFCGLASQRRYLRWRDSTAARLQPSTLLEVALRGPLLLGVGVLLARTAEGWLGIERDGAVAAALVLALLTSAWRWWRARATEPEPDQDLGGRRPSPGEVWWASIPFADTGEVKDRPCLVVRAHGDHYEVLMLTSKDQSQRRNYLPVAVPRQLQRGGTEVSYLKLDRVIARRGADFRRFGWTADSNVMRAVRGT